MLAAARILAITGVLLLVAGGVLWMLARAGFHGLPGDLNFGGRNWRVSFPLATSLVISVILTVLLNLLALFLRH